MAKSTTPQNGFRNKTLQYRAFLNIFSLIFLCLIIWVYVLVPKLRNLQGRTIRHIVIAYALAFALMIVLGLFVNNGGTACEILANLTMIMFVVAYLKLFTLCVELWIMIVKPGLLPEKIWYISFNTIILIIAAILFIISLFVKDTTNMNNPRFGFRGCWTYNTLKSWLIYFMIIWLSLLCSILFFIFSWIVKNRDVKEFMAQEYELYKFRFSLYLQLYIIMFVYWLFENLAFSFGDKSDVSDLIFLITDFINSLLGIVLFILLVVLRKRTLIGLSRESCIKGCICCNWKRLRDPEIFDRNPEVRCC